MPWTPTWICSGCCPSAHLQMQFSNCLLYIYCLKVPAPRSPHQTPTPTSSTSLHSQSQLMASLNCPVTQTTNLSIIFDVLSLFIIYNQVPNLPSNISQINTHSHFSLGQWLSSSSLLFLFKYFAVLLCWSTCFPFYIHFVLYQLGHFEMYLHKIERKIQKCPYKTIFFISTPTGVLFI